MSQATTGRNITFKLEKIKFITTWFRKTKTSSTDR